MKRFLCILLSLILSSVLLTACGRKIPTADEIDMSPVDIATATVTEEETDYVIISVEKYGDMLVRLYPDVAPETVKNFKRLVSERFYDGSSFHRVIKNFMIQGGAPGGDQTKEGCDPIKGEFTSNEFENNLDHYRGVLSMARTSLPDSATCQFFIVHTTEGAKHLNGQYATFGYVVDGIEVVDAIASVPVWSNTNLPRNETVRITSIRFATVGE